jgi:flagella basal body P-ring formation protein FlgA
MLLARTLTALTFSLLALTGAFAAPELKSEITVNSAVVTVGDMFDDPGLFAEEALFRAPAPGTSGFVDLEAIRVAAAKVGIIEFRAEGIIKVRVVRAASVIDETLLTALIAEDLKTRGILTAGMSAEALFDTPLTGFNAEAVDTPAQLINLRYLPGNGAFSARFLIAGVEDPLDVTGRIDLLVEAPHLIKTLPAGAILTPDDIEMRLVPLKYAETAGVAEFEQLIGKQLEHQSREGMLLRAADVSEPQIISRNDIVTLYFRSGPLTLTVKGQALNDAVEGGPVAVINAMSKRVVNGIAVAQGAVEISNGPLNVAGL